MQHIALNRFFNGLHQFQSQMGNLIDSEDRLISQVEKIQQEIKNAATSYEVENINQQSKLRRQVDELNNNIERTFSKLKRHLQDTQPMKQLSATFQDKIIFLVFGKTNAGKSSFCNQIVKMYSSLFPNESVRHFYFDPKDGQRKTLNGKTFVEGITETTAQIQGVELGKQFVLLDSPGLHSVTEENGALTRQFIDSADAVLWLSNSDSPGQTNELYALKYELEKGKPLLPVITRSDETEEDWPDEKNDPIVVIKDKTRENRQLQNEDVKKRLGEFGGINITQVRDPISISIKTYEQHQDLDKSGLAELFEAMAELINEAGLYKGNKAKAQAMSFIKSHVIPSFDEIQKESIQPLQTESENVIEQLRKKQSSIENNVRITVSSELDSIINKHKLTRNKEKVINEVNELINHVLNRELSMVLNQWLNKVQEINTQLDNKLVAEFKPNTISREEITGSGWRSATSAAAGAAGAVGGAMVGSMILPGAGTIIGSFVGGVIGGVGGNMAGEYFVETRTITEEVGVLTDQMYSTLQEQLNSKISQVVDDSISSTLEKIEPLKTACIQLSQRMQKIKLELGVVK